MSKYKHNIIDTKRFLCYRYIMENRIDLTNCQLSGKKYGGAEQKIGVIFNHQFFVLKFRKRNVYGECFNDVAEYIGSTVFRLLGVEAQH